MISLRRLRLLDYSFLLSLSTFVSLYIFYSLDGFTHPMEDAAMLMQYANNVASGYGITYSVGTHPVDGATDFLPMILVAALAKFGLTLEHAVRLLSIVAHVTTVLLVYLANRLFYQSSYVLALFASVYLAVGPAVAYTSVYFVTPVFALCTAVAWCFTIALSRRPDSRTLDILFATTALVLGLTRPEGVFLACFMLVSILYARGLKSWKPLLLSFISTFLVFGSAYVLWRVMYFGYIFPNPFYKKGDFTLHWDGLMTSVQGLYVLCIPLLFILVTALRSRRTTSEAMFSLIPVIGFTAIWILLSNETNYLFRFQYALLPIVVISWPHLLNGIQSDWKLPSINDLNMRSRITVSTSIFLVIIWAFIQQHNTFRPEQAQLDGKYDIALLLSQYKDKNYVMATSEAGLLALYSHWRVVDAWGLNDSWVAHNGIITNEYLDSYKPNIIMFHQQWFSPVVPIDGNGSWFDMIMVLKSYAEQNGYVLAAAFGVSPYETEYYYVRPDFPDAGSLIDGIRQTSYYAQSTGQLAINYATETFRTTDPGVW